MNIPFLEDIQEHKIIFFVKNALKVKSVLQHKTKSFNFGSICYILEWAFVFVNCTALSK